jgi:two-component system chemotaxis response regulator CheY
MKCLVVDPSATMRRIVGNVLRDAGFEEILEASDGTQAAEVWDGSCELLVTEWDLPSGGGIELVREILGKEGTRPRILMLTARNSRDEVLKAIEAGVDAYVLKPFFLETLRGKILQLLQSAQEQKAA